jgi:Protein of unknown function (DUF3551)
MSINPMHKAHAAPRCTAKSKRTRQLVVHLLCEVGRCAACTVHTVVRLKASGMEITATVPARRKRSSFGGSLNRCSDFRVLLGNQSASRDSRLRILSWRRRRPSRRSRLPVHRRTRAVGTTSHARGFRLIKVFAVKLILVIFGILSASAAQAQNAPWCLQTSSDGSLHCTYATFQQCLADRTGGSDFCIQNSTYQPPSSTIRRR